MRMYFILSLFFTSLSINAQVEISGTAKNYKDTVFYISETGGFYNLTRVWRDNKVKVIIGKDRHFKATVPEDDIDAWYIEKAWLKAREQLSVEGEHYLLNEKLLKEANALCGIKSIPHYAIIDKNGDIVNKKADRPADVYTQLLTLSQK